ncbi:MAG: hypothetical protein VR66_14535, partial [Peptococcaceae bacterium BRH_c23]
QYPDTIAYCEKKIASIRKDMELREKTEGKDFSAVIDGKTYGWSLRSFKNKRKSYLTKTPRLRQRRPVIKKPGRRNMLKPLSQALLLLPIQKVLPCPSPPLVIRSLLDAVLVLQSIL